MGSIFRWFDFVKIIEILQYYKKQEKMGTIKLLALSVILGFTANTLHAEDFSEKALEQASAAYLKSNDSYPTMLQLEKLGNGYIALMLARCLNKGLADCPKDQDKAQSYSKQQDQIQQQLTLLAQNNNAEAYNWLGNIERDKGERASKQQVIYYFENSAKLNNAYAMFVLGQLHDTSINGFINDDAKAFEWYEKAAKLGSDGAMYNLAVMLQNGRGVRKDEKKSFGWYQKSADLGNADAMNNLAVMYQNGWGESKNDFKAVDWYLKSADLGHVAAMNNLGWMYQNGRGVRKDEKKAFELYKKSADLGYADAMDNLAHFYELGLGIAKDEKKAFDWYQKSANLGNTWAISNLGWMYQEGLGVTQDDQKAVALYQKAADLGNSDAMNNLATMYYFGRGGLQGGMQASVKWYQKAMDLGSSKATSQLGFMYRGGWGVPRDDDKAVVLYNKAIELDPKNSYAFYNLAKMYEEGLGVVQNNQKADELYKNAIDLGSSDAMLNLAENYMTGLYGTPLNTEKGLELYQKAIALDNKNALNQLAIRYLRGKGVEKDYTKALALLNKAISLNDSSALFTIATMHREGLFFPKNSLKAIEIYKKIADGSYYLSPRAMLELGRIYRDGDGLPKNAELAIYFFKKPTEMADYSGLIDIGYMYETGNSVKQDYNKAATYYIQSLKGDIYNRSSVKARRYLGDILQLNRITDPNLLNQARDYFNPAPSITWSKQPTSVVNQEKLEFSVDLKDNGYGIGQVRLLVDGIAIDQKERDFGSLQTGYEQRNFSVILPKGNHKIRIEANNAENIGVPAVLEMQVESTLVEVRKPRIFAVVVGVDKFQNDSFALKYAVADAKAIYTQIKKQVGGIYEEGDIQLLTTQVQTSKQGILNALEQIQKQAQLDDLFVFYVASHGTTFDEVYHMFTSDLLHTSKEKAQKAAFSTSELQNIFAQIPTSKKIVFIDTCQSGGGINATSLISGGRDAMEDQKMIERMKDRSGVTVLMASGSEQKAMEG